MKIPKHLKDRHIVVHHIIYLYIPIKIWKFSLPFFKRKQKFFLCTTEYGLKLLDNDSYIVSDPSIVGLPEIEALWKKYQHRYLYLQ
jgi:hypothetical protein